jgi:8-amino-7-oxononanoate synthase
MPTESEHDDIWADQLAGLADEGLLRSLRMIASAQDIHVTSEGRTLCSFCSNNYLGLAKHPRVITAVKEAVERWGWGAGASRLISGHMKPHAELEKRLAEFKGMPAALVLSTGYQANLAAVRSLAGKGDVVLCDKLNHASIIDAALGSGAVVRVFPHRDYHRLERLLGRTGDARWRVIVSDSVFSMDGDFADLPRLVELKNKYDALLCIDEAHAAGVLGDKGRGLAELMGVENQIDLVVGTLSKALGGIGGFVAGSRGLIDWIVNTARAFIYTTAVPPAACVAAMAALDIVEQEPERRGRLASNATRLRHELAEVRGYDIGQSACHIVPLIVGESSAAVRLSQQLEEDGLLVPAIRPPTVPRGQARLRLTLSSEHSDADIDHLLSAIDRHWGPG